MRIVESQSNLSREPENVFQQGYDMTAGNFSCLLNYAQGSAPDQQLFNQIPNGKLDFKNQVVRKCII